MARRLWELLHLYLRRMSLCKLCQRLLWMCKGYVGLTALLSQEDRAMFFLAALVEERGELLEELFAPSMTILTA